MPAASQAERCPASGCQGPHEANARGQYPRERPLHQTVVEGTAMALQLLYESTFARLRGVVELDEGAKTEYAPRLGQYC